MSDNPKSFGERLRLLRKKMNLDQAQFASSIHLTRTYLSELETGRRDVQPWLIDTIERLELEHGLGPTTGDIPSPSARMVRLQNQLSDLEAHDSQAFETVAVMVETFHQRLSKEPAGIQAVSSTPDDVARAALAKSVAEVAANPPVIYKRSRGAASPSAKTSRPEPGDPKP